MPFIMTSDQQIHHESIKTVRPGSITSKFHSLNSYQGGKFYGFHC